MKIIIAYALPAARAASETPDTMADAATIEEVKAVEESMQRKGHTVLRLALDDLDRRAFVLELLAAKPDVVVNLVEGVGIDNRGQAYLPGLLELLKIPYTGGGPASMAVCTDKWMAKAVLRQAGVPVPNGALVRGPDPLLPKDLSYPLFIKPAYEDASIGIDASAVCHDAAQALRRLTYVTEQYGAALIEEYIDGREINAAVSDEDGGRWYPLSEIDMTALPAGAPRIVTFAAKWIEDSPEYEQTPGVCPAPLPPEKAAEIGEIALRAYRALHVRGYARIDCRLDAQGRVYVLEVNADPDISTWSGFLRSWKATGRDYDQFMDYLLAEAQNIPKI